MKLTELRRKARGKKAPEPPPPTKEQMAAEALLGLKELIQSMRVADLMAMLSHEQIVGIAAEARLQSLDRTQDVIDLAKVKGLGPVEFSEEYLKEFEEPTGGFVTDDVVDALVFAADHFAADGSPIDPVAAMHGASLGERGGTATTGTPKGRKSSRESRVRMCVLCARNPAMLGRAFCKWCDK